MAKPHNPRGRRISRRIHLAVQNIIYNEMGLSRKSIETQVRQAVIDCAARLTPTDSMIDLADKVISRRTQQYKYAPAQLRELVEKVAQAHVEKLVGERVKAILDAGLKIEISRSEP